MATLAPVVQMIPDQRPADSRAADAGKAVEIISAAKPHLVPAVRALLTAPDAPGAPS